MRDGPRTIGQSPSLAISNEMVRMLSRYTGRGPTKVRTTLSNNVVVVVFHDALTKGEVTLVDAGQLEAVHTMRRTFHELLRADASAHVEEVLGCAVTSCLGDVDPEANVAVVVFVLDPKADPIHVALAEAPASSGSRA